MSLRPSSGERLLTRLPVDLKELERFVKFAIVGTVGAVVDFGVLNLGILVFGLPKVVANTISFSMAVLSNFTWNRLWTFPESRSRPIATQLVQFALVNVAGLGLNQLIFLGTDAFVFGERGILSEFIALLASLVGFTHSTLAYNLAKALATIMVLFWNFGVNRIWTYRGI